ncbi:MAG: NADH-quinone oxidoreductase subunit K [Deltaproteobacteria bacterium RIFCSPLOWO2_12_FULL_43_16]|nr:MAG: NADH-quinone oxidoreductase subunit K [Deltaproteobacteria bacterium GWA2_43_19]OGQ11010.1 MAG: NADH-quinone oxidoreductase subunit K [Deltaproteobacteria bacterium RIFCSPHIGHO2_02_FULL_43_33]OGQ44481.1 MAG: NADH-quinone oxidoreductase subunit K [Deltaproteobacteria bacterium RIFCSPLOWO2_01_FULL_42_9]OGQ60151.1 MAG: NADH-quinone oxidoreductase subunit K [Deltaproteobacteria bacterium RIFCSPLOWO2_12_FULL_43_16]HBR18059.1 NADH-quinone oxidoreductase subunit NuoK [Deltaproteobacteria bacte
MIPLSWYIILSSTLFIIGVAGVLLRRNFLIILMSIELILNSVNINLVAFSYYLQDIRGQMFSVFVITVAAAEAAVALSILVALVRNRATVNVDEITTMRG